MSAANVTVVEPGSGGAMPVMWVPCVVFAHLFAAYFLLGMLSVMYPSTWQQAKARIGLGGGSKGSSSSRAGSAAAASKGGNEQQLAAMGSKGGAKALPPAGAQDQDPELGLHGDSVAAVPAHAVGMPAHSVGSQALIHKLTALVRPMVMQWEDVGCAYNTSTGVKTVLQVHGGVLCWGAAGWSWQEPESPSCACQGQCRSRCPSVQPAAAAVVVAGCVGPCRPWRHGGPHGAVRCVCS
jgi:hypothetical protein